MHKYAGQAAVCWAPRDTDIAKIPLITARRPAMSDIRHSTEPPRRSAQSWQIREATSDREHSVISKTACIHSWHMVMLARAYISTIGAMCP